MEDSLRDHMGEAETAVDGVCRLYADGGFEIDDNGAMAAVAFRRPCRRAGGDCHADLYRRHEAARGRAHGCRRGWSGTVLRFIPAEPETSAQVRAVLEQRRQVDGRQWGAFVANEHGVFANVSMPLARDGTRRGWVVAAVELQTLSNITNELSARFGTHAFILDGDDRVMADERLADPKAREAGVVPLMPLADFGDPVLARYAERRPLADFNKRPDR